MVKKDKGFHLPSIRIQHHVHHALSDVIILIMFICIFLYCSSENVFWNFFILNLQLYKNKKALILRYFL